MRQCSALQPQKKGITDAALLAPDLRDGLQGTLTVMPRPYRPTRQRPTPISSSELDLDYPESHAAS